MPENQEQYFKPFTAININDDDSIKQYILSSNYWANEIAFIALNVELELNIISIELNQQGVLVINRGTFFNTDEEVNNWNKYLFLYNSNGHFELITFPVLLKKVDNENKKIINISTTKIIYNRNNFNDFPPLFILFLIYGNYYPITRNLQNKENFALLKPFMEYIENSLNIILRDSNINNNFVNIFNEYFTNQILQTIQDGGLNKSNNDSSKIAYYITIDMELYPGTSIPPEEMKNIKCRQKWNAVRKAYANMLGKSYVMQPFYENKTLKNKEQIQNNTKKIEPQNGKVKSKKNINKNINKNKNKTIKLL